MGVHGGGTIYIYIYIWSSIVLLKPRTATLKKKTTRKESLLFGGVLWLVAFACGLL